MSAPPDSCGQQKQSATMSGQNHHEHPPQHEQHSNVRHIPIFVEGRDEPVVNKNVDHGTHFGDAKPAYVPPPPQQPHIDREQYFADDGPPSFHQPPNFSRAFGTPFNKGFRQGPQPFVQQKVFPQTAYTRGASPQRSQSPKTPPHHDEHFVKVPVQHEHAAPKTEPPSRAQQRPAPKQPSPQPQPQAPRDHTPPPKQPTPSNDPITQILSIQTDVLNLMTEVENFKGAKNDKQYLFLDEMLTRNLIKLDNIETDGKENIRLARKEAIKCIQKCIAVLEAKAESNAVAAAAAGQTQPQDIDMKENSESQSAAEPATENGEVEMKESTKEGQGDAQGPVAAPAPDSKTKPTVQNDTENKVQESKPSDDSQVQAADTRPEDKAEQNTEAAEPKEDKPKKGTKVVKKRNKSKDNKTDVAKDSNKQENPEDSDKVEKSTVETMQVDDKGDKEPQVMEVDGAASQ